MMNVLVLCTGNSCRSQMAEGYLRHFGAGLANIYSAGIETHGLNPKAVSVMAEDGIDISKHTSNHIEEYADLPIDYVITVCDHAKEHCPYFPAKAEMLHQNFPDPAKQRGDEVDVMTAFRNVRDQIRTFCEEFVYSKLGI
ncbi:MAG: arsenate reductase ArsC [Mucilaginibacter polytrichastri]|nr:arsenate reductase ArsC [Mucilaginibacter polytrichastri]